MSACRQQAIYKVYKVQRQTTRKYIHTSLIWHFIAHYLKLMSIFQWQKLVSWCFKPSQPQRITSGLINDRNMNSHVFLFFFSDRNMKCFIHLTSWRSLTFWFEYVWCFWYLRVWPVIPWRRHFIINSDIILAKNGWFFSVRLLFFPAVGKMFLLISMLPQDRSV